MKKKNLPALGFALALLLVFVIAASIDYRSLNSNQFTTSGTVSINSGALLTNTALRGSALIQSKLVIQSLEGPTENVYITNAVDSQIDFRLGTDDSIIGYVKSGGFGGGGSGLTNLNASSLASGTISYLRAGSLTNHTDVTVTSLQPGDKLAYSGTAWTNGPVSGGGGIAAPATLIYAGDKTNLIFNAANATVSPYQVNVQVTNHFQLAVTNAQVDGQVIVFRFRQNATGSWQGYTTNSISFGSDITGISLSGTANSYSYFGVKYCLESNVWHAISNIRGGGGTGF